MRILKSEVNELHHEPEERTDSTAHTAPAQAAPAQITQQTQVDHLQQQLDELRKQSPEPEARQTHQAS